MKTLALALLISAFAVPLPAQSLGEAAAREKERRKKNEEGGVKAKSFDDDTLHAGAPARPIPSASPSRTAVPAVSSGNPTTTTDAARAVGRQQLEGAYALIGSQANSFIAAVRAYERQGCQTMTSNACGATLASLVGNACAVGKNLDRAEDLARTSWLEPGVVRDLRKAHGMDDSIWDELASLSRTYCH